MKKNFLILYFGLFISLIVFSTLAITALTLKTTSVTLDLAVDSFLRMQYNESEVKTDEMTEQYLEDVARSQKLKNSANFVERTVAKSPWFLRILFTISLIYIEIIIIRMYYDFVKIILERRRKRLLKSSKRKPE